MNVSPARAAAFDILLRIERDRAYSSVLLPQFEAGLTAKDRGLCHEIVLGTLRRQIFLDRLIDEFAGTRKLDIEVRIALRVGLFQLRYLDKIPAYSAISESVELARKAKKRSAAGFVNAILRRSLREEPELKFTDDIERISVETSHPQWLIEKWQDDFGVERAAKLAEANNEIPPLTYRLTQKFRGERSDEWTESDLVAGAYLSRGADPSLREMFERGEIYFQDEGSQMVANAVEVEEGIRFLDVCAAPGGKTTMIAERIGKNAGLVVAGDVSSSRVALLEENCRRQGSDDAVIVQFDAEAGLPFAEDTFDTVLVDAPCSGTGTIRHNPELRYFLQPGDFEGFHRKQLAILQNASKVLISGGKLYYSTCSLEFEENETVCSEFLSENEGFRMFPPAVPEKLLNGHGYGRTFPDRDGIDGFFIAAFVRA